MRRYGDDPTGTPPLWLRFHEGHVDNKARSELELRPKTWTDQ